MPSDQHRPGSDAPDPVDRPPARRRRRTVRRDRHGRGLRGQLAPAGVPLARTRSAAFDELVLDAVEDLERHVADELAQVEFAVEDVPRLTATPSGLDLDPDVVSDRGVPLGELHRTGLPGAGGPLGARPVIVIYRRPVEARSLDREDRAELVYAVVAELLGELLGRDLGDGD